MSSQKGNTSKKKAPAHQNSYAFKHNPNSILTEKILSIPNEGLCDRCSEIIEWKKKYRKYKPLTTPAKCTHCEEKKITRSYHLLCATCCNTLKLCAKCKLPSDSLKPIKTPEERKQEEKLFQENVSRLPERQRRTIIRLLEKDPAEARIRLQQMINPSSQKSVSNKEEEEDEDDEEDKEVEEGKDTSNRNVDSKSEDLKEQLKQEEIEKEEEVESEEEEEVEEEESNKKEKL